MDHRLKKFKILVVIFFAVILSIARCDLIDNERASFFGLTHEVAISSSTLELANKLQAAVQRHARGDRRVRRYYASYDAPFVGYTRRSKEVKPKMIL